MKIGGLVLSGELYRDSRNEGAGKGMNERLCGNPRLVITYKSPSLSNSDTSQPFPEKPGPKNVVPTHAPLPYIAVLIKRTPCQPPKTYPAHPNLL